MHRPRQLRLHCSRFCWTPSVYEGETDENGRPHRNGCLRRACIRGDFSRGRRRVRVLIHYPEGGECCAFDYDGEALLMQPQGKDPLLPRPYPCLCLQSRGMVGEGVGKWQGRRLLL